MVQLTKDLVDVSEPLLPPLHLDVLKVRVDLEFDALTTADEVCLAVDCHSNRVV